MDCPICNKVEAFEDYDDICSVCGWQADPFMSNNVATVKFLDCDGNEIPTPEDIGGKWSSPNHCDSIADAREAWFKYKTRCHFDKDKAPKRRKFTREENDRAFKYFFGERNER